MLILETSGHGVQVEIVGGNVLIEMRTGGTAEYNHETYECINADVCRIENGRVTAGTIRVSEPSTAENPTPIPTPTPTPEPTAAPTATPVRPGKFSEFNGAGAATWRRMYEGGQIVACYEGLALPRDSFCLSEGFRFTPDYSEILDTEFLVAHLPDGDALVLQGSTTYRGGDIRLGWITFENRVITHLNFNASQTSTPVATATATPRPTATPTRAQSDPDRAVLVAFYHGTGGANWDANTNWLSDRPIGEWRSVTTNSNGRVIQLALPGNNLTVTLPAELGGLSNLTDLVLYNNGLTGEILPELGGLSNLIRLSLDSNRLTGEIPPELGGLSNLTHLFLSNNQLRGCIPGGLRDIANNDLAELNLPDCGAATPIPTAAPAPTPTQSRVDGECYSGLVVRPGESCTYPGSSQVLSVDTDGKGRWSAIPFLTFSGEINLSVTVNGREERFVARPQGDGSWIIDEAGGS